MEDTGSQAAESTMKGSEGLRLRQQSWALYWSEPGPLIMLWLCSLVFLTGLLILCVGVSDSCLLGGGVPRLTIIRYAIFS